MRCGGFDDTYFLLCMTIFCFFCFFDYFSIFLSVLSLLSLYVKRIYDFCVTSFVFFVYFLINFSLFFFFFFFPALGSFFWQVSFFFGFLYSMYVFAVRGPGSIGDLQKITTYKKKAYGLVFNLL